MAMSRDYPAYPSREQMIAYLESYAARFEIKPVFDTAVSRLCRDGAQWRADTAQGSIAAPIVVVATGIADAPYRPSWPGSESFAGAVIHSSEYRNPAPYEGKRVLVVGFGNSGGEIALDLANADIDVALAVRGPVQILPRDLLGFPILSWAILYRRLPARLVDVINAPVLRLAVGDIESWDCAAQQRPAADGRGRRARAADRYRHDRKNQGRLDQDTWRHRSLHDRWRHIHRREH
jgi:cation diffusion facilitator CzcD-associated flavoprotein CzcO